MNLQMRLPALCYHLEAQPISVISEKELRSIQGPAKTNQTKPISQALLWSKMEIRLCNDDDLPE